jgi:hypothetical protein
MEIDLKTIHNLPEKFQISLIVKDRICLTDSNELFLVVILVLSYLLVSLNF